MTVTTRGCECNAPRRLLMALELGRHQWMVGFATTPGAPFRQRTLKTAEWARLRERSRWPSNDLAWRAT